MRIGIIGASGNIGGRVLTEAHGRGHHVVAYTRQGATGYPPRQGIHWEDLDIFDVAALSRAIQHLDVLVSSYHPGNSAKDAVDAIGRAIADPSAYARAAKRMLKALETRPATRLIVIGGAANLEIAPGKTTDEDEPRLREVLRSLGVPEDYVAVARGHRDALDTLRVSNRRWTCATRTARRRRLERGRAADPGTAAQTNLGDVQRGLEHRCQGGTAMDSGSDRAAPRPRQPSAARLQRRCDGPLAARWRAERSQARHVVDGALRQFLL